MVTCHHKRNHQKVTGVLILGAAHTQLLTPLVLPNDHFLSTSQTLIDKAKVRDPIFKKQCDEATLNAIHHHWEECLRMPQDEQQNLPASDRSFPHCKMLFEQTLGFKMENSFIVTQIEIPVQIPP